MTPKHPYYDSDRKKKTEELAMRMIVYSVVGMLVIAAVMLIVSTG